ncbi:hypothetical protein QR680_004337 [Steinernema hermaphroditum]|uniref:Uncharacterized protein n=1 Tax=Steinernema hermaphroditum TaxID=289476 RepID=A0AA39LTJ6_9BILA|nr:hypothetical protein QR680_004337 [Steinernema hermaphroditum]
MDEICHEVVNSKTDELIRHATNESLFITGGLCYLVNRPAFLTLYNNVTDRVFLKYYDCPSWYKHRTDDGKWYHAAGKLYRLDLNQRKGVLQELFIYNKKVKFEKVIKWSPRKFRLEGALLVPTICKTSARAIYIGRKPVVRVPFPFDNLRYFNFCFEHKNRLFFMTAQLYSCYTIGLRTADTFDKFRIRHTKRVKDTPLKDYEVVVIDNYAFLSHTLSLTVFKLDIRTFMLDDITDDLGWKRSRSCDTWLDGEKLVVMEQLGKDDRIMEIFNLSKFAGPIEQDDDSASVLVEIKYEPLISDRNMCQLCKVEQDCGIFYATCRHPSTFAHSPRTCPLCTGHREGSSLDSVEVKSASSQEEALIELSSISSGDDKEEKATVEDDLRCVHYTFQFLLCGSCLPIEHASHVLCVKPAVFVCDDDKRRAAEAVRPKTVNVKSLEVEVSKNLTNELFMQIVIFFNGLTENYEHLQEHCDDLSTRKVLTVAAFQNAMNEMISERERLEEKEKRFEEWKNKMLTLMAELNVEDASCTL